MCTSLEGKWPGGYPDVIFKITRISSTKQVTVSGLNGGFPDPVLSLVFVDQMYAHHNIVENMVEPGLNLGTRTVETSKSCKSELNRVYCL